MAENITHTVEVWVRIQKDADGYPESQDWEDLWASPLGAGRVRIESIPFFAKGVAQGDIFTTSLSDQGITTLDNIVERGGHSTFRIWLDEECVATPDKIMQDLKAIGARTELTLERLIAVDVPAVCEPTVWEYLKGGEDRGNWGLQVGYSPDS
jgi:uncharacterized protein DUF4265